MAITKERKQRLVAEYLELINQSDAIFLTSYSGMSVKGMESLRKEVRNANGVFRVTKNTLLKLALEKAERRMPPELLTGQLATGFALAGVPPLAKALVDFEKEEEAFSLHGALLGDEYLSAEEIEAIAKLPTLDQLRAQILGLISAPAQNVALVVSSGIRQVINVMDAYAKSADAAEAA